jgi:ATP-dependent protease Clp ATPase subunit
VLTEAGYVGEDVEEYLDPFTSGSWLWCCQGKRGVFIDEIDKIARKSDNHQLLVMFLEKEYNKLY